MPRAKAPATKTLKKKEPVKPIAESPSSNTFSFNNLKRSQALTIGGVLVVAALLYIFRGVFVAATVNGQPISRLSVVKEMEAQYGKNTLTSMITKNLILQEAQKQKVTVSDAELNDEVKKIEENVKSQGQNLDDLLKAQGLTREKLKEQIKIEKLIQKMVGKDIKVSDQEVDDYINKNKESYPADAKVEDLRPSVRQQLEQQKLSETFQTWLADLQKKAKINYFVTY